ncbi:hypothetical protein D1007_56031 [Hordeum vulgare]|nr:hypothetical protein D1007_56031 [Hordeum vulgare]
MAEAHHHNRKSLSDPATGSQTHTFKPCLIFKDLALKVVDRAMGEVDLLVEGEDDVLHGLAIHLEITGVIRDHEVIGIEPTFHHPLAPKDFQLHSFKPGLHGSSPLGSLYIADVQRTIVHLDSLRVLRHFPQIWVDDVVEELVLGGA